jgi:hypothetical protein
MRHNQIGPRARNAILWGIACFLAGQLGLALAIESGWWRFRDPFYEHKRIALRRMCQQRSCSEATRRLFVMLGSSRTGNGFKGNSFADEVGTALGEPWSACNLGVPGAGPLVELVNLRRILAEGMRPDFVLVEVMPLFLAEPPSYELMLIKPERLCLADIDCLDSCRMPTSPALRRDWWQYWPFPSYAHRFSILSELAPKMLPSNLQQNWSADCDASGWVALEEENSTPAAREALARKVRAQYEAVLADFGLAEFGREALRQVLAECRQHDIPTALILLPEATQFRNLYGTHCRAGLDQFLASLRQEFRVPLIDSQEWVPDHGFPDLFHLNTIGADIFTRRLSREMAPLLQPRDTLTAAVAPRTASPQR